MPCSIAGSRWCGKIGRAHKSNSIYFVVDVKRLECCQRCYDPECADYRGPPLAVPPSCLAGCDKRGLALLLGNAQDLAYVSHCICGTVGPTTVVRCCCACRCFEDLTCADAAVLDDIAALADLAACGAFDNVSIEDTTTNDDQGKTKENGND